MPISLEECQRQTPKEMAEQSTLVSSCFCYLVNKAEEIKDTVVRHKILTILKNPAPTFLNLYCQHEGQHFLQCEGEGLNLPFDLRLPSIANPNIAPQGFWTAPGSSYERHHSYPGGLAVHTATNVRISLGILQAYRASYHCVPDEDIVVAAQILHDCQKAYILQWRKDGSCTQQASLAGTAAHHVIGLAESVYRGLPAEVVIAQACTHANPGSQEGETIIMNWLRIACQLAGKNAREYGVEGDKLSADYPRIEGFITFQGDYNWVLSLRAASDVIKQFQQYARDIYGMSEADLNSITFHSLRNYIFSQVSIIKLYEILINEGNYGFRATVQALVK